MSASTAKPVSASGSEYERGMMAGPTCAMGFDPFTYHGGALEVARRLAPDAPNALDRRSPPGSIPTPIPFPISRPRSWTRLPDSESLAELEAAAAARYRASAANVVAGPGSQALIQALARLARVRRVGALGPTYGGHADAFAAAGVPVEHAASLDAMDDLDVAIVVNPNNPDGRITRRADLLNLHARLHPRGGMLIVDEAFADFGGADETLEPALPPSRAVVLRSFGKAYGLAGLRRDSPSLRRILRQPYAPPSGPGRSAVRRSRSAPARSPISDWLEATRARLARTERGSTPS